MDVMGPERVLPSSEDDLGEDERPVAAAAWSEGGGGEEEEEEAQEDGEEDEAPNHSGSYYYQPLNQEPDGLNATGPQEEEGPEEEGAGHDQERGEATHEEQLQMIQERIEVMGLHLPEAPPPDSDEEQDAEAAAAVRSRASIPMDEDHVELVKRTMAAVALPSLGVPAWAREISDDQWKDMVQNTLQSRHSLNRKHNN